MGDWFKNNSGGIIGSAGTLLGAGIGAVSQGSMNKKTREWSEKMYSQQRADALADWNMQNAYNSPESQMARLKAAGLNPNLVYGNGAVATSGQQPRAASAPSWSPRAPELALGSAMTTFYDIKLKKQSIDNMDAMIKTQAAKQAETYAKISEIVQRTAKGKFDLEMANTLKNNTIAMSNAQIDQVKANTQYTLDQNQRSAVMQSVNISEALMRIAKMDAEKANTELEKQAIYQRIELLKKDNTLRNLDIENYNVQKKPWYVDMVTDLYNKYFGDIKGQPQGAPLSGYEKQDSIFLNKVGKGLGKTFKTWGSWH